MATDMFRAGGVAVVANRLKEAGKLTTTRSPSPAARSARKPTLAEEAEGQEVIRPLDRPMKESGGLAIMRGTSPPRAAS